MSGNRTVHRCSDCGHVEPKWAGRCPACEAWGTLVEHVERPDAAAARPGGASTPRSVALPIDQIDLLDWVPLPTGIAEVDHVLGGGLVPGSVTLIGGEPGIGKSTLLLQILATVAASRRRALYVSAEESTQQVRMRAERLGACSPELWLASETDLHHVCAHIDDVKPELVVVDSIQTIADPTLASAPGSVVQVRECANRLVQLAKSRGIALVLVGHVTKEGVLAGPRVLEHLVDTVLSFEGDRHHALRVLRGVKHRFGPAGEIGVFEMRHDGLAGVPDPSSVFLADRCRDSSGSVVFPTVDGRRPMLVELQALTTPTHLAHPRRSAEGVDPGRLAFLLAVLQSRAGVVTGHLDVYALAVGGVRVREPAADLALCLAIASAIHAVPLPPDLVVCGEVGLGGEVRRVGHLDRRLNEAARLGMRRALVPASSEAVPAGVRVLRVASVSQALRALQLVAA
ncbi:MAG TPA: DNA repair protein RadA [Acidimicrobiales bacterium]